MKSKRYARSFSDRDDSRRWCSERSAQHNKDKSTEAIEGAFSKVAQSIECEVLLAMRAYLVTNRWTVLSLVFDGLMVQHRDGTALDLGAMADYVEHQTQFRVRLVEKPLYATEPDPADVARI